MNNRMDYDLLKYFICKVHVLFMNLILKNDAHKVDVVLGNVYREI